MAGAGIGVEIMGGAKAGEFRVKLRHVVGGWILVIAAKEPDNRSLDVVEKVEWRRTVIAPRLKRVTGVIGDTGADAAIGGRPPKGHTTAHAVTGDAYFTHLDITARTQPGHRRINVFRDLGIAGKRVFRGWLKQRRPVIQIHGCRQKALFRQTIDKFQGEIVETTPMLHNHDGRMRTLAGRDRIGDPHGIAVYLNFIKLRHDHLPLAIAI